MTDTEYRKFLNRHDAGRDLAKRLSVYADQDPVVIGLARGGVVVASEVARALGAPMDIMIVRKIGAPGNPEYGIGALAEGGVRVLNHDALRKLPVGTEELEAAAARARAEVETRVARYRDGRPPLDVTGRTVIVVDDGLATGVTARAALRALQMREPRRLVLAVPVGAPEAIEALRREATEVVCLMEPELMWAVGLWYEHFEPTGDGEIFKLLAGDAAAQPDAPADTSREERIVVDERTTIVGDLTLPPRAHGLVLFAHGSGSSRFSPRNRQVARALNELGLATLLLDLLTPEEELERDKVFDVTLLAKRLVAATRRVQSQPSLAALPVGYFGASTGAAAALFAAAELGDAVAAVVSRGGRPDLALSRLGEVHTPVLLIVGGHDELVLEINREAQRMLQGQCELAVVAGATHLFEEPGALEEVSRLADDWFEQQLSRHAPTAA